MVKAKALSNVAVASATIFFKELQPKNTNQLRVMVPPVQEKKAPLKKSEAAQKEVAAASGGPARGTGQGKSPGGLRFPV